MSKPRFKLRLVPEKRTTSGRDFTADPWMRGEGAKFFTPARVAEMARENEALRKRRK